MIVRPANVEAEAGGFRRKDVIPPMNARGRRLSRRELSARH
jgi:hypothetical protein